MVFTAAAADGDRPDPHEDPPAVPPLDVRVPRGLTDAAPTRVRPAAAPPKRAAAGEPLPPAPVATGLRGAKLADLADRVVKAGEAANHRDALVAIGKNDLAEAAKVLDRIAPVGLDGLVAAIESGFLHERLGQPEKALTAWEDVRALSESLRAVGARALADAHLRRLGASRPAPAPVRTGAAAPDRAGTSRFVRRGPATPETFPEKAESESAAGEASVPPPAAVAPEPARPPVGITRYRHLRSPPTEQQVERREFQITLSAGPDVDLRDISYEVCFLDRDPSYPGEVFISAADAPRWRIERAQAPGQADPPPLLVIPYIVRAGVRDKWEQGEDTRNLQYYGLVLRLHHRGELARRYIHPETLRAAAEDLKEADFHRVEP